MARVTYCGVATASTALFNGEGFHDAAPNPDKSDAAIGVMLDLADARSLVSGLEENIRHLKLERSTAEEQRKFCSGRDWAREQA